uniref:Uncharacterized protein n=1 Tax=Candidatus Entotheonella serta TaxID=1652106 RepID=A0A2P1AMA3_9BACT|nr:hypothetical protein [Candidatus Entotheonella serta]
MRYHNELWTFSKNEVVRLLSDIDVYRILEVKIEMESESELDDGDEFSYGVIAALLKGMY